jgi:hypothetical protein
MILIGQIAFGVWAVINIASKGVEEMLDHPIRFWAWLLLAVVMILAVLLLGVALILSI